MDARPARYAFGEHVLDTGTRQLLRAGREVPLPPKVFTLLELLLRSRPQALSRTRLVAALWPDAHVGPSSLHALVSQARSALGDDGRAAALIRTVSRYGYAFAAEVQVAAPSPRERPHAAAPRLVFEDRELVLDGGETVLGRDATATVPLVGPGVSRRHARIVAAGGQMVIEDLGSKNGTFVGGERLTGARVLEDGDVVRLGQRVEFQFTSTADRATDTEAP